MSWTRKAQDAALFTSHLFHGLSGFFAGVAEILDTALPGEPVPRRDTVPSPGSPEDEIEFAGISDKGLEMIAPEVRRQDDLAPARPLDGSLAARRRPL